MDYKRLVLLAVFTIVISCVANMISNYTGFLFNIEIIAVVLIVGYVTGISQMVLLYKKQMSKILNKDSK